MAFVDPDEYFADRAPLDGGLLPPAERGRRWAARAAAEQKIGRDVAYDVARASAVSGAPRRSAAGGARVLRLFGLCAPYGRRTCIPPAFKARVRQDEPWRDMHEIIDAEAFTPGCLEAQHTELWVNHQRTAKPRLVRRNGLRLFTTHAGLYVVAYLDLSDPVSQTVLQKRALWRGWSVGFDRTQLETRVDAQWPLVHVVRCEWLSEISVLIDRQPSFAETWITSDLNAGLKRMKAENEAALRNAIGPNYKAYHPALWHAPQQAAWLERGLRATNPHRFVPADHVFRV